MDTKAFPDGSTLFLFKDGIQPLWEDFENMNGGKYAITLQKAISSQIWSDLVLATIGEQLDSDDQVEHAPPRSPHHACPSDTGPPLPLPAQPQICGIVLATRLRGNVVSIWVKNAPDPGFEFKDDVETVGQGFKMVSHTALMCFTPNFPANC